MRPIPATIPKDDRMLSDTGMFPLASTWFFKRDCNISNSKRLEYSFDKCGSLYKGCPDGSVNPQYAGEDENAISLNLVDRVPDRRATARQQSNCDGQYYRLPGFSAGS